MSACVLIHTDKMPTHSDNVGMLSACCFSHTDALSICHSMYYMALSGCRDVFTRILCFIGFQPYCLFPSSLCFSACSPMTCVLHSYSYQPANTLPISCQALYLCLTQHLPKLTPVCEKYQNCCHLLISCASTIFKLIWNYVLLALSLQKKE